MKPSEDQWPTELMGHTCGRNRVVTRCPHLSPEQRRSLDAYWERVTSEMIADSILEAGLFGLTCPECGATKGAKGRRFYTRAILNQHRSQKHPDG